MSPGAGISVPNLDPNIKQYYALKCAPDAVTDSLQPRGMYEFALGLQRILKGGEFNENLPADYKVAGDPLFIRSSNSIAFAVPLKGDDIKNGEYSAIVKLHNPLGNPPPEFGNAIQQYAKVAWCTLRIGELGFPPVAETYASGVLEFGGERIPWSMEQRLRGKEVKQLPNQDVAEALWEKTGQIAASILKIEPSGYGSKFDPSSGIFTETWESYLKEQVAAAKILELQDAGILTATQAESLSRIFGGLRQLDQRYPAALSHRDLSPQNNIFFNDADLRKAEVVGVIDFEQAASVPGPVYEIAMTQWYETVFNREIRLDRYLRGMGLSADDYNGTQLEKDCNAVLLLKLCPHILFYHNVRNEDWAPAKEALPRMLGKLSALIETLDK